MRLINTESFSMHEFHGAEVPQYVILSHRWQGEEVSFEEFHSRQNLESSGWKKVKQFCQFAGREKHKYVWIDTCCIDKTSSAELSESINSMYQWYKSALVCYAYLSDVPQSSRSADWREQFKKSRWFTRGWTLQELLAPRNVVFVSQDWTEVLGSRRSLKAEIHAATGIPESALFDFKGTRIGSVGRSRGNSVAEVMSWAARRTTTRVEDVAYSLMGLFGIQMPLLYGEGTTAFLRLQLEIITRSDDESVFAWNVKLPLEAGLLTMSPALFAGCNYRPYDWDTSRPAYSMTNKGLQLEPLLREIKPGSDDWLMPLNIVTCDPPYSLICIKLRRSPANGSFARVGALVRVSVSLDRSDFQRHMIRVPQDWHS